jgi:hypothetical protein
MRRIIFIGFLPGSANLLERLQDAFTQIEVIKEKIIEIKGTDFYTPVSKSLAQLTNDVNYLLSVQGSSGGSGSGGSGSGSGSSSGGGGTYNPNLADKTLNETITGFWTFNNPITLQEIKGTDTQNLVLDGLNWGVDVYIDKDNSGNNAFTIYKGLNVPIFIISSGTGNVGIGTEEEATEKLEVVGNVKASQFISTVPSGTAPFQVTSTTLVPNLNSDLLDSYHASVSSSSLTIPVRNSQGAIEASGVRGNNSQDLLITSRNFGTEVRIDEGLTGLRNFRVTSGTGINLFSVYSGTGNVTIGNIISPSEKLEVDGNVKANQFISTVSSVPPFQVSSAALVQNLNSDLLDGYHASPNTDPNTIVVRNSQGNLVTPSLEGTNAQNLLITAKDYSAEIRIDESLAGNKNFKVTKGAGTNLLILDSASGNLGVGTSGIASEKLEVVGNVKAAQFISTVTSGTSPFQVSSNTLVSNLNADLLDNYHASVSPVPDSVVARDSQGAIIASEIKGTNSSDLLINAQNLGAEIRIDADLDESDYFYISKGTGGLSNALMYVSSSTTSETVGINGALKVNEIWGSNSQALKLTSYNGGVEINFAPGATSTDLFKITKGANTSLFVLNFSTGNVGIGTTSPSEKLEVNGNVKATQFISTATSSIPPLQVASSTLVPNLNADLLDGYDASISSIASTIVVRDSQEAITVSGVKGTNLSNFSIDSGNYGVEVKIDGNGLGNSVFRITKGPIGTPLLSLSSGTGNLGIGTTLAASEKLEVAGNVKANRFISTVSSGTSPFQVASTTLVNNLNADLLDDYHVSVTPVPDTIVARDSQGAILATEITGPNTTPLLINGKTNGVEIRINEDLVGNDAFVVTKGTGTPLVSVYSSAPETMVVNGVLKATELWTSTLSLDGGIEINIDKDLTGTDFFEITKGSGDNKTRIFTAFSGTGNVGIGTSGAASEKLEVIGNVKAQKFISTAPSGTPPFEVTSNTLVSNLNTDLLDGYHASVNTSVNTVVVRDNQGKISVFGVEGSNSSDLLISGKDYGVEVKIDEGLSGNGKFIISKGDGGLANALVYVNSSAPETLVVNGILKTGEIWGSDAKPLKISSLDYGVEINIDSDLDGTDSFQVTKGSGNNLTQLLTIHSGTGNVGIGTATNANEKLEVAGNIKAQKFISTVTFPTPPFSISSNALVSNLNSDLLDSYHASNNPDPNTVVVRDGQGFATVFGLRGSNSDNLLISGRGWGVEVRIDESLAGDDFFEVTKGFGSDVLLNVHSGTGNVGIGISSIASEKLEVSGNVKAQKFISTNTSDPPLQVSSSVLVSNLNSDLLDGYHASTSDAANTIVVRDNQSYITVSGLSGPGGQDLFITGKDYGVEIRIDEDLSNDNIFAITKGSGNNISTLITLLSGSGNLGVGTATPTEKIDVNGNIKAQRLISTVPTGTAPLQINSTTIVTNLNSDLLDGYHASSSPTLNTIALRDGQGSLIATRFISTVASGTPPLQVASDSLVVNLNADLLDGYNASINPTANTIATRDASGNINANQFISSVATGTPPLQVTSSTLVTNLNSDFLDNYHASISPDANTVVVRDGQGNIQVSGIIGSNASALTIDGKDYGVEIHNGTNVLLSIDSSGNTNITGTLTVSGTINGNLNGNAATASRLQTARNISLSGALSGSTSFDGSADVVINASINAGAVGTTQLADGAITSDKIADNAVTSSKIAPNAVGTTQIADGSITSSKLAPDVVIGGGSLRIFKATIGDTTNTSYTITHNFGTRDVSVSVFANSGDYDDVEVEIKRPTDNTVEIKLLTPPGNNALRVIIIG